MESRALVIIGGGPAGLAAAVSAREAGEKDILLLERDVRLGGILNQCIHNGFGLHRFKEELTGPEYADRYIKLAEEAGIDFRLESIVLDITPERVITYVSPKEGVALLQAGAVILAMGCRERPRGALNTPGSRPAGIYTAGTAQRLINIEGKMVGRRVVILGSGDIGLIMARRMTLEGAKVLAVAEIMPYSGGLRRNIEQCLNDFGIPLLLSHTVSRIDGRSRVTGIEISKVDEKRAVIPGTEQYFECDTLLLSCGLLPENELSRSAGVTLSRVTGGPVVDDRFMTVIPGIFACGNVLHVHDLVDYVSDESGSAGRAAAAWLSEGWEQERRNGQTEAAEATETGVEKGNLIPISCEGGVRYTVPAGLRPDALKEPVTVRFRVADVYRDKKLCVYYDDNRVMQIPKRVLAPGEMETCKLKPAEARVASVRIVLED